MGDQRVDVTANCRGLGLERVQHVLVAGEGAKVPLSKVLNPKRGYPLPCLRSRDLLQYPPHDLERDIPNRRIVLLFWSMTGYWRK